MYQAICFSPDGDYITDAHDRTTIDEVWARVNDWGSRWIFYPFCFVTTDNKERIVDVPDFPLLRELKGKSIKTVQQFIVKNSELLCNILNSH